MHPRHVVGVALRGAGVIGRHEQVVVGNETRSPVDELRVLDEKPCTLEEPPQLVADELVDARTRHRNAEQEEPQQHGQLIRVAEPPHVGGELGRAREELVAGSHSLLDPARLVACVPQPAGDLGRSSGALRARGIGASGRCDGTDWLHGWAPGRVGLEGLVRLQVVPELDARPE